MSLTFIDIETVPVEKDIPSNLKEIYHRRFKKEVYDTVKDKELTNPLKLYDEDFQFHWEDRAGLYAEFGKVVAISLGTMGNTKFFVKGLASRNEKVLLEQFLEALEKSKASILCAHNGKEFDFPFLVRRLIIHGLPVPECLNTIGKKPWEVKLEDTLQMWAGTQWNYKVSLELLCQVLNVPTPKTDIVGSDVAKIYYGIFEAGSDELVFDKEEAALKKISKYCSGDVVAAANCFYRMKNLPVIQNVEYI